ncbi:hypothetical protein [Methylobacterium radiotolerans]|uniref:hypothetical protein n=1 Tax=Methylobacterium radiotolerans TaxID=31998 RepID=UPI000D5C9863|nr:MULTISPECIES: hypothetical protein [Methylobacterium]MDE3748629.1 hypothetical protein [Methylobacterium radiotolerans]PVZ05032.1 hypothetical protein C7388_10524 [Methylobacterium organophilum]
MRAPGTLPRDRSVYDGRRLVGTVRNSTSGVMAFNADGKIIGTFANQKLATAALIQMGEGL